MDVWWFFVRLTRPKIWRRHRRTRNKSRLRRPAKAVSGRRRRRYVRWPPRRWRPAAKKTRPDGRPASTDEVRRRHVVCAASAVVVCRRATTRPVWSCWPTCRADEVAVRSVDPTGNKNEQQNVIITDGLVRKTTVLFNGISNQTTTYQNEKQK